MVSPTLMKIGALIVMPVSRVIGFVTFPCAVSPLTDGWASVTFRLIFGGSWMFMGLLLKF